MHYFPKVRRAGIKYIGCVIFCLRKESEKKQIVFDKVLSSPQTGNRSENFQVPPFHCQLEVQSSTV